MVYDLASPVSHEGGEGNIKHPYPGMPLPYPIPCQPLTLPVPSPIPCQPSTLPVPSPIRCQPSTVPVPAPIPCQPSTVPVPSPIRCQPSTVLLPLPTHSPTILHPSRSGSPLPSAGEGQGEGGLSPTPRPPAPEPFLSHPNQGRRVLSHQREKRNHRRKGHPGPQLQTEWLPGTAPGARDLQSRYFLPQ